MVTTILNNQHLAVVLCILTHMEIFGCNNFVSYKAATRLKVKWICNIFYLVATLLNGCKHLVTTLK